jgi:putative ABC transport system permease protein
LDLCLKISGHFFTSRNATEKFSFENIVINLTVIPILSNYLTIAFRNFYKFRFYTPINVLGLTIGITACLVIFLYVRFELSYDKYHENADRIMRVDWDLQMSEEQNYQASVTPPVAQTLVSEYPEVEAHYSCFCQSC